MLNMKFSKYNIFIDNEDNTYMQIKKTIVMQAFIILLLLNRVNIVENKIDVNTNIKIDNPTSKFTEIIKITLNYRLFIYPVIIL